MDNSSKRPNSQVVKVVHCQDWKEKHLGQHNMEVPSTKATTDMTGTSPQRNGNIPVDYLQQAALRRTQCDMTAERWNSGISRG
jgi:hypothetical protein